ncbi:MAG: Peptidoglycan glycosyltransferase [Parcubacteria group bacterium GW2011_GWB1_45_7]|nr:MAG: Peptidoglycan glycosyltransferase [Parcubacteria group bacterium GW2011_GWB1_45_7]
MGIRITVVTVGFALLYSLLGLNMWNIQVKKGELYRARAASQHELAGILTPKRGSIYFTDKDGSRVPAAINKEYPTAYAVPSEIEDPAKVASILSTISNRSEDELVEVLARENDPFEPIAKRPTEEQITFLEEQNLHGVYVEQSWTRFYPLNRIASHILGFSSVADDPIGSGRYGLELYGDDVLRGEPGSTDGDKLVRPKNGEDLYLTIDRNIQFQAEKLLGELVAEYSAESGTVIVENPTTGAILAMASKPDFDPNTYGEFDIGNFLNPAVQSIYEPGSIMKVLTMSAGIDAGKITPSTTFFDTGSVTLNGRTIENFDSKSYGEVTMTNVIEKSINTGAVFAERAMGPDVFYNYLTKFGINEKKGIDLPGEIVGSLRPLEYDPRDINFATASFGQGISVTPIGLITAIGAIANDGVMMKPYLNKENSPEEIRRVISADTAKQVQDMMVSGVNKAVIPVIEGYNVAGKTGTAQIPNFITGGYTDDVINTYVGFAPAYDPAVIVLIKIDKPVGGPPAGMTVVPAFRELTHFVLNYYGISPDNVN